MTTKIVLSIALLALALTAGACGGTDTPTGPTTPVPPILTPTATIGGVVLDALNGNPIPDVTVEVVADNPDRRVSTRTDGNGRYRLPGVQLITFNIRYTHPKYLTYLGRITIQPGTERTDVDARLTPSQSPGQTSVLWSDLAPLSPEAKEWIINHHLNYFGGAVKRWNNFPITVYADPYFNVQDVTDALNIWQRASNGKVTFQIVSSRAEAKIVFNNPPVSPVDGFCRSWRLSRIEFGVILAGYYDSSAGRIGPCRDENRINLAWGLGNIFGLGGGTTAPGTDVMSRSNPVWGISPVPSEVVTWLHSVPPNTRPQ